MWNRIAQAIAALGGLAALIDWMERSRWLPAWMRAMLDMLGPHLGAIVSISLLSLVCIGLWRIAHIETRLNAVENKETKNGGQLTAEVQLRENELLHENMLWRWDGNTALGPHCPCHQERLLYKPSFGPAKAANFEEGWLSAGGWFICPNDPAEVFRIFETVQVKTLRITVADRFRLKFGLSS